MGTGGRSIRSYGTTHADYFYGEIPCARSLTAEEVEGDYEKEYRIVIIETFKEKNQSMYQSFMHESWTIYMGKDAAEAVHNAVVLEK